MPYQSDLDRLLTMGARYQDEHATYVIECHPLDDVVLPTGQVVGCDPLTSPDPRPFLVTVPPGRYRTRAWVALVTASGSQRRVAALQLVVRDEPAVRWEMALTAGQDVATLDEDSFYGYPVDAGAGTLADLAAVQAVRDWDYEQLDEVFISVPLPEEPVPGAVSAVVDDATGANLVTTSSGWGDGVYPTWIGYTASGEVTSYVTDFLVVPED